MHTNFVEIEEMIEQADVPIGCPACADMTKDLRVPASKIFGSNRRYCPRPHVGNAARIHDRPWGAGTRVKQRQDAKLRMQSDFVVVNEVADDLHAGPVDRRLDRAAQYVEMAIR